MALLDLLGSDKFPVIGPLAGTFLGALVSLVCGFEVWAGSAIGFVAGLAVQLAIEGRREI